MLNPIQTSEFLVSCTFLLCLNYFFPLKITHASNCFIMSYLDDKTCENWKITIAIILGSICLVNPIDMFAGPGPSTTD